MNMIPGEIKTDSGMRELNVGSEQLKVTVANSGDRPIQVGSHKLIARTHQFLAPYREKDCITENAEENNTPADQADHKSVLEIIIVFLNFRNPKVNFFPRVRCGYAVRVAVQAHLTEETGIGSFSPHVALEGTVVHAACNFLDHSGEQTLG